MSVVDCSNLPVSSSRWSVALRSLSSTREVSTRAVAARSPLRRSSSVLQAAHHGLPGGLSYMRCRISSDERERRSCMSAWTVSLVFGSRVGVAIVCKKHLMIGAGSNLGQVTEDHLG